MPIITLLGYHGLLTKIQALGPIMVFSATSALMAASIVGTVVAFFIYRVRNANASVGTSQSLTLLSSAVSFVFVGLYLLAARRNEPVSKARPPTVPLHGVCFIIMRITALLWTGTMVVALGTTLSLANCQKSRELCLLQRVDMMVSIIAILAAGVILFGLENCDQPFKTPSSLNIQPRVTCRISYFDDILERSVSRSSSFDDGPQLEHHRTLQVVPFQVTRIKRTSTSEASELFPRDLSRASTLVEDPQQPGRHALCSTRAYPMYELACEKKISGELHSQHSRLSQTGRCISLSSMSSNSQSSLGSTWDSSLSDSRGISSQPRKCLRASPSSSINSSSQRSPLSTMRNVENPDIAIETHLRFSPTRRGSSARELSILHYAINAGVSPMPTRHVKAWQRRASAVTQPLELRRQIMQSRSVPHSMVTRTSKVLHHIPSTSSGRATEAGANSSESGMGSHESALDAHTQIIEESIQAAVRSREAGSPNAEVVEEAR